MCPSTRVGSQGPDPCLKNNCFCESAKSLAFHFADHRHHGEYSLWCRHPNGSRRNWSARDHFSRFFLGGPDIQNSCEKHFLVYVTFCINSFRSFRGDCPGSGRQPTRDTPNNTQRSQFSKPWTSLSFVSHHYNLPDTRLFLRWFIADDHDAPYRCASHDRTRL